MTRPRGLRTDLAAGTGIADCLRRERQLSLVAQGEPITAEEASKSAELLTGYCGVAAEFRDAPPAIHFIVPAPLVTRKRKRNGKTITTTQPELTPQPRQRHRIAGKGDLQFVQNYTSKTHPVTAFKAAIRKALDDVYIGHPFKGPIRLSLLFVFPRPSNMRWKRRPMPREWKATAPDRDNMEKAVSDALKGLAWIDDGQVCAGPVYTVIAAGDEQPHVEVLIEPLAGVEPPAGLKFATKPRAD